MMAFANRGCPFISLFRVFSTNVRPASVSKCSGSGSRDKTRPGFDISGGRARTETRVGLQVC